MLGGIAVFLSVSCAFLPQGSKLDECVRAIESKDELRAFRAIEAVLRMKVRSDKAAKAMLKVAETSSADSDLRSLALEGAARVVSSDSQMTVARSLAIVLQAPVEDKYVRAQAARSAQFLTIDTGALTDALLTGTKSEFPEIRAGCYTGLGARKEPIEKIIPALSRGVEDEAIASYAFPRRVCIDALKALAKHHHRGMRGIGATLRQLSSKSANVRVQAAGTLVAISPRLEDIERGEKVLCGFVRAGLSRESDALPTIRTLTALEYLALLDQPTVSTALLIGACLSSREESVARAAAECLRHFGKEAMPALPALRSAASRADPSNRRILETIIISIQQPRNQSPNPQEKGGNDK